MFVYVCVCERVSEDSIWTVPSLPVGRGTTWISVNHSLTSNPLGSHRQRHTHARKPRYLHIHRYASTLSQPAVLSDRRSYIETERREEVRVTVRRTDWIVFSGCESESGIHSGFFKPMCHPAGETTHRSFFPFQNMSSNYRSQ